MINQQKVGAVIVAAGRGERMGGVAISIESQREAKPLLPNQFPLP